ncbi:autotransporter outer membrane beta-barrel domain-containing protein [Salmonella enterica]|nr:autotransporter outer membrane beta-barrel domain-containing protein [Salmonella enterica]EHK4287231.1 autotransporter outer membrane beta-barrel domain-containing protein [Salmonella enterica]EHK4302934.1 autotransporter outer membrane beta-barrel domain-containing protein [Salmonella enterica]
MKQSLATGIVAIAGHALTAQGTMLEDWATYTARYDDEQITRLSEPNSGDTWAYLDTGDVQRIDLWNGAPTKKSGITNTQILGARLQYLKIINTYDGTDRFVTTLMSGWLRQITSENSRILISNSAMIDEIVMGEKNNYTIIENEGTVDGVTNKQGRSSEDEYGVVTFMNGKDGVATGRMYVTNLINKGTIIGEKVIGDEISNTYEGYLYSNAVETSHLLNEGRMTISGNGLTIAPNRAGGDGYLANSGSLTLAGAGAMNLKTNYGNLLMENNGDIISENFETGIAVVRSDGGSIYLKNNGNLVNVVGGNIYSEFDSTSPAIIENNGYMRGGIVGIQFKGRGDETYDITVRNGETGTWESNFKGHSSGVEDTHIKKVENKGIIRTLGNDNGSPSTLKSRKTVNSGTIDISHNSLIIDGDYVGEENATLETSARLGGDETNMSSLTINGTAYGKITKVKVNNLGGEGGTTVEGIKVVAATANNGDGFTKAGRIVAGSFDYDLVRIEKEEITEWRLISTTEPGPTPPVPPGPTPPVPPKPVHKMRPEAGTYAENLRQANTLFLTGAEQRRGVGTYTDAVTGQTDISTLWLSQTGGHARNRDASGQLNNSYNHYTVQLGGALFTLPAGDDGRLEVGVQGGYGHARGESRSALTGYGARGTMSGYSTGIYSTWRQHQDGQSGGYVSTGLQYSWLKNQVKGDDLAAEKYDARGTTLSLEGGYDLAVWQGGDQNSDSLFIRPHAQVTRMGVKADSHREVNGTRVSQQGDGNVFSRTGARVWLDKAVTKTQRVQPFVEANWIHNTRDFCSSMDGVRDCQAGNRDQAEVLAGVTGDVSRNVAVTAQAGGQFGSQAGHDLAGTLNVSVKF